MAVKGDQDPHLKETYNSQNVCEPDESQLSRSLSNGKLRNVEACEEQRLTDKTKFDHKGGKESNPGWVGDSGNLMSIRGACSKKMVINKTLLRISGETEERENNSKDSQLSKHHASSTISKSAFVPTSSSSLSPLSSQRFVAMEPNISKHKLAFVSNLEAAPTTDTISDKKTANIFLGSDFPTSNSVEELQAQTEVSQLGKIPAAVNASLQFTTSLQGDKELPSEALTSTVFCRHSQVFTDSTHALATAAHGFRFKDVVSVQEKNTFVLRTESIRQSSDCLRLEDNSKKNPEDLCVRSPLSSIGRGPLIASTRHAPINSSAARPRSNSVPNYTNQNQVSSESESKTPSGALLSSRGAASRISSRSQPISKQGPLRRGKWTVEEETYVARVIQDFNSGYLEAPAGTTLRTFLSDKLNCDPMRITKKFTGDACIGKRVFHPAIRCVNNATTIDKAQNELKLLEHRWRRRIEIQRRESAKKQAASVAAAAAASGRLHLHGHITNRSTIVETLHQHSINTSSNDLAQTASWLDRANAILSNTQEMKEQLKTKVPYGDSVEKEMEEVQRLIHEGPIIQKTSAGFTMLFETGSNDLPLKAYVHTTSNDHTSKEKISKNQDCKSISNSKTCLSRKIPGSHTKPGNIGFSSTMSRTEISEVLPASKRLRKAYSTSNLESVAPSDSGLTGAAEDAATLMGFLSSVRQAAASTGASLK